MRSSAKVPLATWGRGHLGLEWRVKHAAWACSGGGKVSPTATSPIVTPMREDYRRANTVLVRPPEQADTRNLGLLEGMDFEPCRNELLPELEVADGFFEKVF